NLVERGGRYRHGVASLVAEYARHSALIVALRLKAVIARLHVGVSARGLLDGLHDGVRLARVLLLRVECALALRDDREDDHASVGRGLRLRLARYHDARPKTLFLLRARSGEH